MLEIRLRFSKEIWNEMLDILDTDPATKVYINFEEGIMSTTFLFFNDIDEREWNGYITGITAISKTAPFDEGNMLAFRLREYDLHDIREILDESHEPILKYSPRKLYTRQYQSEKLTIEPLAKNMYQHRGNSHE